MNLTIVISNQVQYNDYGDVSCKHPLVKNDYSIFFIREKGSEATANTNETDCIPTQLSLMNWMMTTTTGVSTPMTTTTTTMERTMQMLRIHLQNLDHEIESIQSMLDQLEEEKTFQTSNLRMLQQRRSEKENLLRTFQQIQSFRQDELVQDQTQRHKVVYGLRCFNYLHRHSTYRYKENDMLTDEAIEYAHKLHLIRCLQQWSASSDYRGLYHPLHYPKDEHDYYAFELMHNLTENHVVLCILPSVRESLGMSTTPTLPPSVPNPEPNAYAIPYEHWHALYEYGNDIPFTIDSGIDTLHNIVCRTHVDTHHNT